MSFDVKGLMHLSRPWGSPINYWAYLLFCICYLFCSKGREDKNHIIWKYLLSVGSNLSGSYSSGDRHHLCAARCVYLSLNLRTRFFEHSVPQLFADGKTTGPLVEQSPPSSVEIRSEWSCTFARSVRLRGTDRNNFTSLNRGQVNGCLLCLILNRNGRIHTTPTVIINGHLMQYPGIFIFVVHDLVFGYLTFLTYWLISCNSLIILIFFICNSV
jgi:hypothetical protein